MEGWSRRYSYSASGRLAVQAELLHSGQGYRLDNSGGFTYYRLRLHYL